MTNQRSTKRQRELLNFIDMFIHGNGYGPSYREIMRGLGYKSVSTVAVHVDNLIKKGYLRKKDNSARSLEVITMNPEDAHKNVIYKPSPAQEKWIVGAVNSKINQLIKEYSIELLDEVNTLIEALKILGLEDAHENMQAKLAEHLRAQSGI